MVFAMIFLLLLLFFFYNLCHMTGLTHRASCSFTGNLIEQCFKLGFNRFFFVLTNFGLFVSFPWYEDQLKSVKENTYKKRS
jgi:hypothetical protein